LYGTKSLTTLVIEKRLKIICMLITSTVDCGFVTLDTSTLNQHSPQQLDQSNTSYFNLNNKDCNTNNVSCEAGASDKTEKNEQQN